MVDFRFALGTLAAWPNNGVGHSMFARALTLITAVDTVSSLNVFFFSLFCFYYLLCSSLLLRFDFGFLDRPLQHLKQQTDIKANLNISDYMKFDIFYLSHTKQNLFIMSLLME